MNKLLSHFLMFCLPYIKNECVCVHAHRHTHGSLNFLSYVTDPSGYFKANMCFNSYYRNLYNLFFPFVFMRQGLSTWPWPFWNLVCRPDCAGLKLTKIHLPLPPLFWDSRYAPLCLAPLVNPDKWLIGLVLKGLIYL